MKNTDLPSKEDTILAINRFMRCRYRGLCLAYDWKYPIEQIIKTLGGKLLPHSGYYWTVGWHDYTDDTDFNNRLKQASKQRMIMLAFLLTWAEDPDFEV